MRSAMSRRPSNAVRGDPGGSQRWPKKLTEVDSLERSYSFFTLPCVRFDARKLMERGHAEVRAHRYGNPENFENRHSSRANLRGHGRCLISGLASIAIVESGPSSAEAGSSFDSARNPSKVNTDPSTATAPPPVPSSTTLSGSVPAESRPKSDRRRLLMYAVTAVVVAVIVVVAGTLWIDSVRSKSSGSSTTLTVLVPKLTLYILPAGQFDASQFMTNETATVNGSIDQTGGINVYTMTPAQLFNLSRKGAVSGYEWEKSYVTNGTVYTIDLNFASGAWAVVFLNPSTNPNNSSSVGFLTGLYLQES